MSEGEPCERCGRFGQHARWCEHRALVAGVGVREGVMGERCKLGHLLTPGLAHHWPQDIDEHWDSALGDYVDMPGDLSDAGGRVEP